MLFTKEDLRKLIMPLLVEQLLVVAVGMADTIMISSVGEAAVSGVSLVDTINILLINIFAALATGGAVTVGHALGKKERETACQAAEQLFLFVFLSSVAVMAVVLLCQGLILTKVFGKIEADVMENAKTYLWITAFSIPFIAVYNGGAAIFRIMNNARISMVTSMIMNGVNICGNALLIYGAGMGVEGAAIPTLVSRMAAALLITCLLFRQDLEVCLRRPLLLRMDWRVIKRICRIGVPNGIEDSVFQLGKIMILSLVTGFGTTAITANAVANSVGVLQIIPGMAINLGLITVCAQCAGARDYEQARYYTRLLMKYAYIGIFLVDSVIILLTPLILKAYHLTPETSRVTEKILIYVGICTILIWVPSFGLPNTFRAAGDVKYTMCVSMFSMWVFRIGFSVALGKNMGMGVFGVWVAMTVDWLFRGSLFVIHYIRGKWTRVEV